MLTRPNRRQRIFSDNLFDDRTDEPSHPIGDLFGNNNAESIFAWAHRARYSLQRDAEANFLTFLWFWEAGRLTTLDMDHVGALSS